jgi:hypothetical protein
MLRLLARSLAAASMMLAAQANAHDFWIEPSTFAPQTGEVVSVRLRVGEHFTGDVVPRPPSGFRLYGATAEGRRAIGGRTGADPAGMLRVQREGLQVLAYDSEPIPIEIAADTFAVYLKEEGLESILAVRGSRGQGDAPGKEIYSRHAKSLLMAGAAAETADLTLGLPLELVAERSPYSMAAGEALPLRLLHHGRPLPGALVVAFERSRPHAKVSARSDSEGRVSLQLARAGHWLVKAVHMVAAPPASGADWQSRWASVTFELGGSRGSATAVPGPERQ